MDCGYKDYGIIPKLVEAHEHDFTYDYVSSATSHWGQCECAKEDLTMMEPHQFGDWQVTKIATTFSEGEEARSCSVCDYTETRATDRQGHKHTYYDWDYIDENGYMIEDGEEVYPFSGSYGKTDKNYHYAYCMVEGCKEIKKVRHDFGSAKWIVYPSEEEDGVFYKICGQCNYQYDGKGRAGKYEIVTKDCNSNVQVASPGTKVKLTPKKEYEPGYYFDGDFDVTYTWNAGKNWERILVTYHEPDAEDDKEYWYFTMPEVPDGTQFFDFYVEAIANLWECEEHEYELMNAVEETCGKDGYTGDLICKICNYTDEEGTFIPATEDHGELILINERAANCTQKGYTGDWACEDCGKIMERGQHTDYYHPGYYYNTAPVTPTCTSTGVSLEQICTECDKVVLRSKTLPKLPHEWEEVEEVSATCKTKGTVFHYQCVNCDAVSLDGENELRNTVRLVNTVFSEHKWAVAADTGEKECTVCGKSQESVKEKVSRIYGKTRYETSYAIADALKVQLGVSKFEAVIVANGQNFPDALAGSYLANKKNAPILMASENTIDSLETYITANLKKGGMIYVLGGTGAVPESVVNGLKSDYQMKRLKGSSRYQTNLEILKEAGVDTENILICTGENFADSLSVSATGKPILLVGKTLTTEQKAFLETVKENQFYIIGGGGAVSEKIEAELKAYGGSIRISGASRYETSIAVAEQFFDIPAEAVLAYANNFPDGLSGGPLVYAKNAPLILTANGMQTAALEYAKKKNITFGSVLGGASLISDATANEILGDK